MRMKSSIKKHATVAHGKDNLVELKQGPTEFKPMTDDLSAMLWRLQQSLFGVVQFFQFDAVSSHNLLMTGAQLDLVPGIDRADVAASVIETRF